MSLIQEVEKEFKKQYGNNAIIKDLIGSLKSNDASYIHAQRYAEEVGKVLASTLNAKLPKNSTLEANVIKEMFERTLGTNYQLVSAFSYRVQKNVNDRLGLNFEVQVPKLSQSRVDGLVKKFLELQDAEKDAQWVTQEPVVTFSKAVATDHIQENAEFYHNAGMKAVVRRTQVSPCCEWCAEMAGEYEYPKVPKAVYRRHDRCDCVVEFIPSNGKGQTIHSGGTMRTYTKNAKGVYTNE